MKMLYQRVSNEEAVLALQALQNGVITADECKAIIYISVEARIR
jgi:hypothetical protein